MRKEKQVKKEIKINKVEKNSYISRINVWLLVVVIIAGLFTSFNRPIKAAVQGQSSLNVHSAATSQSISASDIDKSPDKLIRFHVIANSDSAQDQALKLAVRDAILEKVSPLLAASKSLAESRRIVQDLRPEMEQIARSVVKAWGKDYPVCTQYGKFSFPTKSYGSLVLPAGEYEALKIVIGKGEGANWWCVLFPPLCFVDIEHSTAVQVDGKPGIPIKRTSETIGKGQATNNQAANSQITSGQAGSNQVRGNQGVNRNKASQTAQTTQFKRPEIRFWIWDKLKELFKLFF